MRTLSLKLARVIYHRQAARRLRNLVILLALALGAWCVYYKKLGLIRIITFWYSALVVWNLMVLLAAPGLG